MKKTTGKNDAQYAYNKESRQGKISVSPVHVKCRSFLKITRCRPTKTKWGK